MRTPVLFAPAHAFQRIWQSAKALLLCGLLSVFAAGAVNAQEFVWAPDFTVGTAIPQISAQDQDGVVRNFDDLKGEKGLLLMLSRSFDW